jgi:integrase/recombinase XerC
MEILPAKPVNVPLANPTPLSHDALIAAFFAGRTETTLRAYRRDLEDFRRWAGEPSLSAVADRLIGQGTGQANALVWNYRAHLLERGLQPATINRRIAALKSLVKLARMLGLTTGSLETPGVGHEAYRDTTGPGVQAFAQMLRFLHDEDDSPRKWRDLAILRLLFDLGLRRGEVVSLDVEDVEMARERVWVKGKGKRERTPLTLPQITLDTLQQWLQVRPQPETTANSSNPLFVSFDRAKKGDGRLTAEAVYLLVRRLGQQAGVKTAPHGLRHTAITEACKAAQSFGIGLEEVLDFSRHKSVSTLLVYRDRERNVQGKLAELVAKTSET